VGTVVVSFYFLIFATCARLSWSPSAFQFTLNSPIVSYRIVSWLKLAKYAPNIVRPAHLCSVANFAIFGYYFAALQFNTGQQEGQRVGCIV